MQTFLQYLLNGIAVGAIYALIGLGYTMVYGILKLINFAHGDVFMLGSFVGYYAGGWAATHLHDQAGTPMSWVIAAAIMLLSMILCGAFGYLNERIAYRPLRNAPRIASLITAIGVSVFLVNKFIVRALKSTAPIGMVTRSPKRRPVKKPAMTAYRQKSSGAC